MNIQPLEILLVEDNRYDEELTLIALRDRRLANHVQVARDGAEALELLLDARDSATVETRLPKVILLDIQLPKVDGLTVLQRIRTDPRTRDIAIFLLISSPHDERRFAEIGPSASGCIVKPVDFLSFTRAMCSIGLY
jgi:CheY-like chemotaxis protein